jgi:hypothetical protein
MTWDSGESTLAWYKIQSCTVSLHHEGLVFTILQDNYRPNDASLYGSCAGCVQWDPTFGYVVSDEVDCEISDELGSNSLRCQGDGGAGVCLEVSWYCSDTAM